MERNAKNADEGKILLPDRDARPSAEGNSDASWRRCRGGRRRRRCGGRQGERRDERARRAKSRSRPRALAQVDILNQQIAALRKQLAAIQDALDAAQTSDRESQAKIADLGQRLNVALAQKVQELSRYRSDFFGRLRQILGLASRHPRRRRPLRVRILGAVRIRQGRLSARQGVNRSRASRAPCSISSVKFRPTFPGSCASTATPTRPISGGAFKSNWELSVGARHRGRAISDRQRRRAALPRRGGLRRIPADRQRNRRRGAGAQPAHRAEADGAVRNVPQFHIHFGASTRSKDRSFSINFAGSPSTAIEWRCGSGRKRADIIELMKPRNGW